MICLYMYVSMCTIYKISPHTSTTPRTPNFCVCSVSYTSMCTSMSMCVRSAPSHLQNSRLHLCLHLALLEQAFKRGQVQSVLCSYELKSQRFRDLPVPGSRRRLFTPPDSHLSSSSTRVIAGKPI